MVKLMSEPWIKANVAREDGAENAGLMKDIIKNGYLSLLMIVDESGKVAAISKLDKNANAIGGYRP